MANRLMVLCIIPVLSLPSSTFLSPSPRQACFLHFYGKHRISKVEIKTTSLLSLRKFCVHLNGDPNGKQKQRH